MIKSSFERATK